MPHLKRYVTISILLMIAIMVIAQLSLGLTQIPIPVYNDVTEEMEQVSKTLDQLSPSEMQQHVGVAFGVMIALSISM